MARRASIDTLVKSDVVQRRAPIVVVAHADVVVSVRGSVGGPREYDYGLCGWVDADAFELGGGVVVGGLVVCGAGGVGAGAGGGEKRVSKLWKAKG